ncbi:MAG: hypothetical protein AAGJ11_13245 [Bacteroidota bacterium]
MTLPPTLSNADLRARAEAAHAIHDALRLREHERYGDAFAFAGFAGAFAAVAVIIRLPAVARALAQLEKWGWIGTFVAVNALGFGLAGAVDAPMLGYLVACVPLLFSVGFLWVLGVSAADWVSEAEGAMLLRGIEDGR